jgi:hypothetical protein
VPIKTSKKYALRKFLWHIGLRAYPKKNGLFHPSLFTSSCGTADNLTGEVVERRCVTVARKGARCVPSLLFSSITLGF